MTLSYKIDTICFIVRLWGFSKKKDGTWVVITYENDKSICIQIGKSMIFKFTVRYILVQIEPLKHTSTQIMWTLALS